MGKKGSPSIGSNAGNRVKAVYISYLEFRIDACIGKRFRGGRILN